MLIPTNLKLSVVGGEWEEGGKVCREVAGEGAFSLLII